VLIAAALNGDTTFRNGSGNDNIVSGDGNDNNVGNGGNDNIARGDGDDTLTGGLGADVFSCRKGEDIITDYNPDEGHVKAADCESLYSSRRIISSYFVYLYVVTKSVICLSLFIQIFLMLVCCK
jgi:Ca2+-binding RTX toxin-like protein